MKTKNVPDGCHLLFKVKGWSISNTLNNEEVKPSIIPHESNKQSEQPAVSGGAIPLNETSQDGSLQLVPQSDAQKVLGSHWESTTDTFNFSVCLNFSSKQRKVHTGPNLCIEQIPKDDTQWL